MRDIIFRGMTEDGRMVEGSLVWQNECYISTLQRPGKKVNGTYTFDDFEKVSCETIGQYTGLTDKNGKRIFEGDIVENADDRYIIEWSGNEAKFVLSDEYGSVQADFDNFWGYELEVIGNIHENKDLLEVESENG